jgi:hypothetical protein
VRDIKDGVEQNGRGSKTKELTEVVVSTSDQPESRMTKVEDEQGISMANIDKDILSSTEILKAGISGTKSITSSTSSAGGSIRPLVESRNTILYHMTLGLFALALNVLLLSLTAQFNTDFTLAVDPLLLQIYGGVFLEIILLISNIITIIALDKAASVIFGSFLTSKRGYSLAACGFISTRPLFKFQFAQQLLLSSKSRKLLSRVSLIWLVAEVLKVLTPFCAVAFSATSHTSYSQFSDCMYFTQDNRSRPVDRGFPTFDTEGGVAEYVFGSSLGFLRSEMNVKYVVQIF